MGYIIPALCQTRKVGSPTQKAVLMAMATYAWEDGRGVWVSKMTLAADLELSRRTIQMAVDALMEKGILVEVGMHPGERGPTVEYRIVIAAIEALPFTRELRKSPPNKLRTSRTVSENSVHLTTGNCASDDRKPCSRCTQLSKEYLNKNTRPPAREAGAPTVAEPASSDDHLTDQDKGLRFIAEKINGDDYVPPSILSTAKAQKLIDRGWVTPARMKEKGITF